MLPRIGFALLLSVGSLAVAGEIYTWKDANGHTHFGDRPPAQQVQPARAIAVAPPLVSPQAEIELEGTWQSSDEQDGRTLLATVTFNPDHSFSGQMQVDGQSLMSYEGQWRIADKQLHWSYTKTSIPLPESLMKDSDTILSASADHLELQSALSGEVRLFSRVAAAAGAGG